AVHAVAFLDPVRAHAQDGGGAALVEGAGIVLVVLVLLLGGAALVAGWFWRQAAAKRNLLLASLNATSRARQLVDSQGRVLLSNDAFDRLFGVTGEPLPKLLQARVAPGSDAAEILRQLMISVAEGGRGRAEIEVAGGDGAADWFDVSGRGIDGFPGHILW